MTPSLSDLGIALNITAREPETRFILKDRCSWEVAIDLAKRHRIEHPEEPIEIIPCGDFFSVCRIVVQ
jgi:hypothetical protein